MKVAVQIGHVNGQAGAAYEEEILRLLFPHVVAGLRAAGFQVQGFDGSLQFEPANNQYDYAAAVFLHCDAWSVASSGFSIGYWEEMHPGSEKLAKILHETYGRVSGLQSKGFNITVGEHHYYGNRRFTRRTKCALIEFGFVSNPTEREFLRSNADKLGTAVAKAVSIFLGAPAPPEEEEVEDMLYRDDGKTFAFADVWPGRFKYWLHVEGPANTEVKLIIQPHGKKAINCEPFRIPASEYWGQDLLNIAKGYGVTNASFILVASSSAPVIWGLREYK